MRAWYRIRLAAAFILVLAFLVVLVTAITDSTVRQNEVAAAKQLASQSAAVPVPISSASDTLTPSPAAVTPTPSKVASTPAVIPSPPAPSPQAIVYPIKGFAWPAAGINVSIETMARSVWQPQLSGDGIDPPLDGNGFEPVGYWLAGTGIGQPNAVTHTTQIAAHTCYGTDASLCNDTTFPFNLLSFSGWAVGQHASILDNEGHVFDMTLVRREVAAKSGFSVDDNPCEVQVFSCNKQDPHARLTLVTYRFTACPAAS